MKPWNRATNTLLRYHFHRGADSADYVFRLLVLIHNDAFEGHLLPRAVGSSRAECKHCKFPMFEPALVEGADLLEVKNCKISGGR